MVNLKSLKLKRSRVRSCITRAYTYCAAINDTTSLEDLEARFKALEMYWQQYTAIEDEICEVDNDDGDEADIIEEETFEQYEAKYLFIYSTLLKAIKERKIQIEDSEGTLERLAGQQSSLINQLKVLVPKSNDVALPKITIPKFSGDYSKWSPFRDLFIGSVDSKSNLTKTQKFYYLISFLDGEALNLIQNIPVSEDHYLEAWDKLESRYDRPHLCAFSYIQHFFKLPSVSISNHKSLRKIVDGADECLRGLKAIEMNNRDPWLIYLLLSKLDANTRQLWSEEVGSDTNSTIYTFLEFLGKKCTYLESNEMLGSSSSTRASSLRSNVSRTSLQLCLKCKQQHQLFQCNDFNSLNVDDRRKFIKENNLCFNCLKYGHNVYNCSSKFSCRVCNKRHHSLVHFPEVTSNASINDGDVSNSKSVLHSLTSDLTSSQQQSFSNVQAVNDDADYFTSGPSFSSSAVINNHVVSNNHSQVILPTAIVRVKDNFGNFVKLRALIDSGSQVSFISESCVQILGLHRSNGRLSIMGVASTNAGVTKGQVKVNVFSSISLEMVSINAYILKNITADIPSYKINNSNKEILSTIKLADPKFNVAGSVDLLLGADIVWSILKNGKVPLNTSGLFAINSMFGWIISGQLNSSSASSNITSYVVSTDIDKMLQQFWDIEEGPVTINRKELTNDDPAEIHFRSTHSKSSDGKYIVDLPFKIENATFYNTLRGAISRLHTMETRFRRNKELQRQYVDFMREYELLGHMEKIPDNEIGNYPQYYLPHHAVLKPDSSTTKLRVVFDGSFKDSFGQSLNETLLIGPSIQRDLFGVSIRFRRFSFVFTADITKMFRQIWISKKHRDYQRIVWRSDSNGPVHHYRLCTVTYGTSCAPFLSVRVLQQLAADNKCKFPKAAALILNNIYVDDIMAGSDDFNDLQTTKKELVSLLDLGGFKLRKWSSNSPQFLAQIPKEDCELAKFDNNSSESYIKLLGLYWNPDSDTYSFRVHKRLYEEAAVTKRKILSDIARIFDIFGFLAPSTILMKMLLQKLWLQKVTWDDPLPSHITQEWLQLRDSISYFQKISIPRKIFILSDVEVHCFCDASSLAYAAVIYSVFRDQNNEPKINLIAAKTKVAPLKVISIPRMELCAAALLCRLYSSVKESLNLESTKLYAWTDSEIVLHWLSSPPRTWKVFVSHRTEEILSTIPRKHWNYVSSEVNPADCASRGLYPQELLNYELWWNGPPWLKRPESEWPKTKFNINEKFQEVEAEQRKNVLCSLVNENQSILLNLSTKISSWTRLLRIISFIQRFVNCLKNRRNNRSNNLTYNEIQFARTKLLLCLQNKFFANTISCLKKNQLLSTKDPLSKLSPFLDSEGLVRVGGRIQEASVSFNIKHPIIIPKCQIAELIIYDLHQTYLHVGASELFIILRQQYWVLGARNLVRSIVFKCKRCFMLRRQTSQQLMANLPTERVQQHRPFFNSGCDFAGPLTIKMTNCKRPRVCKAYIALFICMSTKALHLELVSDLSAEAFIAAFKRFISRRGKCCNLYTDNGTNFHGARRILSEMTQMLLNETTNADIAASIAKDGTSWHFIPPSSPHFGGMWESNVKSVKLHLKRVVGSTLLSFEEMYTVLVQIEAILNSRPLCAISDHDLNPLTPSHFITGEPLTAVPEPNYLATPLNRLKHYKFLQHMVQGFWKRWSAEYITSLQQRPKWQNKSQNLAIGDLVVLKEPNIPQAKWLLGRISEVHPGPDGCVRVVTIKTEKSSYRRPVTKIARLPVN